MTGFALLGVFILGVCVGALVHCAGQAVELACEGSRRRWRARLGQAAAGGARWAVAWMATCATWLTLGLAALT